MKYQLIDRTPEELKCSVGICPAIYNVKELPFRNWIVGFNEGKKRGYNLGGNK